MNIKTVAISLILASFSASAAAPFKPGWVHPRVVPAELAFLKGDVPMLTACLQAASGDCGLKENDFAGFTPDRLRALLASGATRIEFTEAPDMVHVKFAMTEREGEVEQAVLVYARTEQGLKRQTAALALELEEAH